MRETSTVILMSVIHLLGKHCYGWLFLLNLLFLKVALIMGAGQTASVWTLQSAHDAHDCGHNEWTHCSLVQGHATQEV